MDEGRITRSALQDEVLRGQEMKTPDDVAAMLRLKACGWGIKRIARELGCSHHKVKHYVAAGGVKPFKSPQRPKLLDGHEVWLRERFIRHRGNADVVRQDLAAEKGLAVSRRTLQRAVQPYRQALQAEALATVRFETAPGQQLQIDFGERLVETGGRQVKAFVFVATLGYSRRLHVRAFRNEKQEHWFAGLESAFRTFGGVPETVLMDNPRALVVRHDAASRTVAFNEEERDRGAQLRELGGVRGASRQVGARGCEHAGDGTTGEAPIARFEREEAHRLKPLGDRPSFGSLRELSRVVGNDCAIEVDTNSYSVPWRLIGERVAVTIAAGEVRIRHGVREVAVHRQSEGRRQRIVDPRHLEGVAGSGRPRSVIDPPPVIEARPRAPLLLRPLAEYEAAIGGNF